MNARQHAQLFSRLVEACGGATEAAKAVCSHLSDEDDKPCRWDAPRLSRACHPHNGVFATSQVIDILEAYCGRPIYSAAMAAARPSAPEPKDLMAEVLDIMEGGAALLGETRSALSDGKITPVELSRIDGRIDALLEELQEARAALKQLGARR